MAVTQARLNEYRAEVGELAEKASRYVRAYLLDFREQYPDASVSEARECAIEAVDLAVSAFGDQAAGVACELFDEITGMDSEIYDVIDPAYIDQKVRYYARKIVEGDYFGFTADVRDLTKYYVKRSAFQNMVENCERNDVLWARVPSGLETCAFCFMLSSRGFAYTSERSALVSKKTKRAYHLHCDCVAVPGFAGIDEDSQIEGYEPSKMADRWSECARAVGADSLPNAEARRKAVLKEVETRDWRWLYTGDVPEIDTSALSNKKLKKLQRESSLEWSGYVNLSKSGVLQKLLAEDPGASANIDFIWNAGGSSHYWELKTPRADEWALVKLLEDGYSKWERLSAEGAVVQPGVDPSKLDSPRIVVDNRYSRISDDLAASLIKEQMVYLSETGNFDFTESILIRKDGSLSRIEA